jgi:hypothetical protein
MASLPSGGASPEKEPWMRNATAIGLVVLLVVIVGAAAFQLLIALG